MFWYDAVIRDASYLRQRWRVCCKVDASVYGSAAINNKLAALLATLRFRAARQVAVPNKAE